MALVLGDSILQRFMGFSICALAMLKLMDVESFAASFVKYDLVTQRWRSWAKVYPGVELLIGLKPGIRLCPRRLGCGGGGVPGMASVLKAIYIDKLALNWPGATANPWGSSVSRNTPSSP